MGWVKVDDGFFLHPKVIAVGSRAATFHLAALCWAGSANTDGFVPEGALRAIAVQSECSRRAETVRRLCAAGLWHEAENGYVIHDYLQWQSSADDRSHQRERNRAKAERNRQRAASNRVTNPGSNPGRDRSVTGPEAEAEVEKKKYARSGGPEKAALEAEFDVWYRAYPRKRERKGALAKYMANRRAGVSAEDLLTAAQRYAEHGRRTGRPAEMTKHPATFLNNGWDDWVPGGAVDQEAQTPTNGRHSTDTMGPRWANSYDVPVIQPVER